MAKTKKGHGNGLFVAFPLQHSYVLRIFIVSCKLSVTEATGHTKRWCHVGK